MTTAPEHQRYVLLVGESLGLIHTDSLIHHDTAHTGFGGAESNVAIGLSRLGVPATWLGRLGADGFGDLIERELRAEAVGAIVLRDPIRPTGLMTKERSRAGRIRVSYHRSGSAGAALSGDDITDETLAGAALVHLTGITLALSETARDCALRLAERARALDIPVSFDVNYRSGLWPKDHARAPMLALARQATVVFAGPDEAELITGDAPADLSETTRAVAELGPREVIIKLGEQGSFALIDGTEYRHPALPITPVDTVGAGDAFVAGYLAERQLGADPGRRLVTANQAGALACLGPGDWESNPYRRDLLALGRTEPVMR